MQQTFEYEDLQKQMKAILKINKPTTLIDTTLSAQ